MWDYVRLGGLVETGNDEMDLGINGQGVMLKVFFFADFLQVGFFFNNTWGCLMN